MLKSHQSALGVGFSIVLLIEQIGCVSNHVTNQAVAVKDVTTTGAGRLISGYSELRPDADPGKRADMVMAGTRIPVNVTTQKQGSQFNILLRAHDETFETEEYRRSPTSFSLVGACGDHYSPELDLVRFPMHIGDTWSWSGRISSGGIRRKASATVTSYSSHLYEKGVGAEAVKVEVDLSLFSEGSSSPAARKLIFDFVPEKGIVRREFGDASVREAPEP